MPGRNLRGGFAGAVATVLMTLEQPVDQRLFGTPYDDVEILGKLFTRGGHWRPVGFALHVQNGAFFGAAYTRLKPSLPGPAIVRGLTVGLVEHVVAWPLTAVFDRYHPARKELPRLFGNRRAFGQATARHAVFGIVLGLLEDALDRPKAHPPWPSTSAGGFRDQPR